MKFRGLFIGIDRYASAGISRLTMAKRDARAMYALFTDTLGSGATLILDQEATRDVILTELNKLTKGTSDEFVVLYFSGHGSRTNELVTYDTVGSRLSTTAIPLDDLAHIIGRIPSQRVLCILDCCFSGALGAKVLLVDGIPRNLQSTDALLDQLSGKGRIVLTASTADQPAYEHQRLGHGILTSILLEALQGAEEVRESNRVKLYPLLEFVVSRVIDKAKELRCDQTPTFRGSVDGEFILPIFMRGATYDAAFPETALAPVNADIQSLAHYGFPGELLTIWKADIPSLNELQIDAVNDFGVLRGEHIVVSAPTSSGKTMIGELAALKAAIQGQRALFLLPLRALVNDKYDTFNRMYQSFGITTIRATGEISDDVPALMRGQYDICLMTYEKFSALALTAPHLLRQVATIVVDEVQMISDASRGVNVEFLLTMLLVLRQQAVEPQVIALSAVIGDTNGLERWLGARLLRREKRPVPLVEGIIRRDGSYRYVDDDGVENTRPAFITPEYRKGTSQDYIIPLIRKLVNEGKQSIIFRATRGEARGTAGYLATALGLPPAQAPLSALPTGDPSNSSVLLRDVLVGGVAFHISDLDRDERRVIEEEFRKPNSQIRVIAATTTLAMGVNTPATAVIISGLEHPGQTPYAVAEYKNMVGRAGRLGFVETGESYLIPSDVNEFHAWNHYVTGKPEAVISHFLANGTDVRTLILRILTVVPNGDGAGMSREDVIAFLEGSFAAFQQRQEALQWQWSQENIEHAITQLMQHQLIEHRSDSTLHLTEVGHFAGQCGIEVESILRMMDIFRAVPIEGVNDLALITATQATVELDEMYFPINKKSIHKEPNAWFGELHRQGVPIQVASGLSIASNQMHPPVIRAKRAVACLMWVMNLPMTEIEQRLMQFSPGREAAGEVRGVTARTADILPAVARIAQFVHPTLDLDDQVERLLARLQLGIDATSVDLAFLMKTALTRAEYKQFQMAGLHTLDDIEQASDQTLLPCVNNSKAMVQRIRDSVAQAKQNGDEDSLPAIPFYQS